MKKILALLMLAVGVVSAQVVTPLQDSTGTAVSSHWQRVDFGAAVSARDIEVYNTGPANLLVAVTATDTGAARTAYQKTLAPRQAWSIFTNQRYVYLKAGSGTVVYRVGTGSFKNLAGSGVFSVTTTFTRDSNITTYAANDIFHKTPASLLVFQVANANGGTGFLTGVTVAIDSSNTTNASFKVWILSDSAGVTLANDNAAHILDSTKTRFLVGTAIVAMTTGGSTSTATSGSSDNLNLPFKLNGTSRNLYAYITAEAAYVPPFVKKVRLTLKGVND